MTTLEITASDRNGTVRLAVGLHAALGFLLLTIDVWTAVLPQEIGLLLSGRSVYPLLPCIGLFWVLIAATLLSRRSGVVWTAIAAHAGFFALSILGLLLAAVLLMPVSPERRGHGAGMGAVAGVFLLVPSIVLACSAITLTAVLWRIRKCSNPNGLFQATAAKGLAIAGATMLMLNVVFVWQREASQAAEQVALERTFAHESSIGAVVFSPDGSQLASASGHPLVDPWVRIWDVETGKIVTQLPCRRSVADLEWSNDGQWLVAGCGEEPDDDQNGSVMIWQTNDWNLAHEFGASFVSSIAVSQDSQFVAAGASENRSGGGHVVVMLYHLPDFEVVGFGDVPFNLVESLTFNKDGRHLVAAGRSQIAAWDLLFDNNTPPTETLKTDGRVTSIVRVGDEFVYVTSFIDQLRSVSTSPLRQSEHNVPFKLGHQRTNEPMLAGTDDRIVVAEQTLKQVMCVGWPSGETVFKVATESPSAIAITRSGEIIAIATDQRLNLHDGRSGTVLRPLTKP